MSWFGALQDIIKTNKGKPEGKKKNDPFSQMGASSATLTSLQAFMEQIENYPSDSRVSPDKLAKIFKDETVRNACDFLTYMVMKRVGLDGYYHEDPEIQQLVTDAIQNMDGSFYSHCRDLLVKGIFFGYATAQLIFDNIDGRYLFGWMVNYPSEDIEFMVSKNERNKEFISKIKRESEEFSAENFILYQYGDLSNVYGFGRGNYLEKYYDIKLLCLKLWPIYMQKFTIPTIVGKTINDLGGLLNRIKNWLYNNIITIVKDQEELELIERKSSTDASQIYEKCLEFVNKVIYRVFFMLSLLAGGETGGSYALGEKHFDLFMDAAEEIASDFRDNVIISQIFTKLIEYNYGPQLSYGEFRPMQALSMDEKDKLSNIYYRLISSGVIDPVADEVWIRKDFGLPEKEESELDLVHPESTEINNNTNEDNENDIPQKSKDNSKTQENI